LVTYKLLNLIGAGLATTALELIAAGIDLMIKEIWSC